MIPIKHVHALSFTRHRCFLSPSQWAASNDKSILGSPNSTSPNSGVVCSVSPGLPDLAWLGGFETTSSSIASSRTELNGWPSCLNWPNDTLSFVTSGAQWNAKFQVLVIQCQWSTGPQPSARRPFERCGENDKLIVIRLTSKKATLENKRQTKWMGLLCLANRNLGILKPIAWSVHPFGDWNKWIAGTTNDFWATWTHSGLGSSFPTDVFWLSATSCHNTISPSSKNTDARAQRPKAMFQAGRRVLLLRSFTIIASCKRLLLFALSKDVWSAIVITSLNIQHHRFLSFGPKQARKYPGSKSDPLGSARAVSCFIASLVRLVRCRPYLSGHA